jgi:branched-subunit amino acid permease
MIDLTSTMPHVSQCYAFPYSIIGMIIYLPTYFALVMVFYYHRSPLLHTLTPLFLWLLVLLCLKPCVGEPTDPAETVWKAKGYN